MRSGPCEAMGRGRIGALDACHPAVLSMSDIEGGATSVRRAEDGELKPSLPPSGWTAAQPMPKVTFGIIVLNGEPFVRYCLRSLYPFAH